VNDAHDPVVRLSSPFSVAMVFHQRSDSFSPQWLSPIVGAIGTISREGSRGPAFVDYGFGEALHFFDLWAELE